MSAKWINTTFARQNIINGQDTKSQTNGWDLMERSSEVDKKEKKP